MSQLSGLDVLLVRFALICHVSPRLGCEALIVLGDSTSAVVVPEFFRNANDASALCLMADVACSDQEPDR